MRSQPADIHNTLGPSLVEMLSPLLRQFAKDLAHEMRHQPENADRHRKHEAVLRNPAVHNIGSIAGAVPVEPVVSPERHRSSTNLAQPGTLPPLQDTDMVTEVPNPSEAHPGSIKSTRTTRSSTLVNSAPSSNAHKVSDRQAMDSKVQEPPSPVRKPSKKTRAEGSSGQKGKKTTQKPPTSPEDVEDSDADSAMVSLPGRSRPRGTFQVDFPITHLGLEGAARSELITLQLPATERLQTHWKKLEAKACALAGSARRPKAPSSRAGNKVSVISKHDFREKTPQEQDQVFSVPCPLLLIGPNVTDWGQPQRLADLGLVVPLDQMFLARGERTYYLTHLVQTLLITHPGVDELVQPMEASNSDDSDGNMSKGPSLCTESLRQMITQPNVEDRCLTYLPINIPLRPAEGYARSCCTIYSF